MTEVERVEKDPDTGRRVKKKVHVRSHFQTWDGFVFGLIPMMTMWGIFNLHPLMILSYLQCRRCMGTFVIQRFASCILINY